MLSSEQQKTVRNVAKKSFNKIDELFISHKLPNNGFSEGLLIQLLECLAAADSNNFNDSVGGGEREGRVSCPLVGRLHYGLSHGIGRSGNVAETQPKALGSSMLNSLANSLALEALHVLGIL
uniref:O-phosphoseryl-tRNA(Sec) selenium transferase n=1 Tax=Panagrolaimus sp. ES5 TaxID=591445 RepID=A0AC34GCG0_9BILA